DAVLERAETKYLITELDTLLQDLRRRLAKNHDGFSETTLHDADVHLGVALSLLRGNLEEPVRGGSAERIAQLYQAAVAAQGPQPVALWQVPRVIDFSQMKPRGHYQDSQKLSQYFRAVMWLE